MGGLTPTTDTDLLLATYRGGSHFTSDIQKLTGLITQMEIQGTVAFLPQSPVSVKRTFAIRFAICLSALQTVKVYSSTTF